MFLFAIRVFRAVRRANRESATTGQPVMLIFWIMPGEWRAKFQRIIGEPDIVKQAAMILARHRNGKRKKPKAPLFDQEAA